MESHETTTIVSEATTPTEHLLLDGFYCNSSLYIEESFENSSHLFCNLDWDGISCWPITLAGSTALMPCMAEFNRVRYDISGNASRDCLPNGTWSTWTNYRSCTPLKLQEDEYLQVLWDMRDAVTVYYVGYGLSLIALSLALFIFIYFKDLRCLRNTIHANLMFTYLLIDITWILTANLQSSQNYVTSKVACFMVILLTYLLGTNFFWMFVEGLYLFILVVKTFSVDNIKIQVYAVIGWGIPAVIAATWAGIKGHIGQSIEGLHVPQGCPYQNRDYYDYIFISPVLLVLLANIIFLTKIMWVLITKLRATNTVESEQYRKAAKALLVLIPLLGVTYILVIATPSARTAEVVFTYIQATLLSIQGFIVAVLYCFLNGEVQHSVRHRLERWKMRRAVDRGQHHSLNCRTNSHEEKFYRERGVRDSCISFATSTSFVTFQGGPVPTTGRLDAYMPVPDAPSPIKDDAV